MAKKKESKQPEEFEDFEGVLEEQNVEETESINDTLDEEKELKDLDNDNDSDSKESNKENDVIEVEEKVEDLDEFTMDALKAVVENLVKTELLLKKKGKAFRRAFFLRIQVERLMLIYKQMLR